MARQYVWIHQQELKLPPNGFDVEDAGYNAPAEDGSKIEVAVNPRSNRLQLLTPFVPITQDQLRTMRILIKTKGKCTTDHISMAGPWLKYRGHLENISENCFIGAINAYNDQANHVINYVKNDTCRFLSLQEPIRKMELGL